MISIPETHKLDLRNRLHWILDVDCSPLSEHQALIAQIADELPHSIKLVTQIESPESGEHSRSCHAYTFDLIAAPPISTPNGDPVVPSAEFVEHMTAPHLQRPSPQEGDIVVYFEGEAIEHSGRWRSGRVHSKWGVGHIWSHQIYEVPSSYGCTAKFYESLSPAEHQSAWESFARPYCEGTGPPGAT